MKRGGQFNQLLQVGGHPALDLINTVEHRGSDDPGDLLSSMGSLVDWCESAGLLERSEGDVLRELLDRHPADGQRMLDEAKALREAGRNVLAATMNASADIEAADFIRERIQTAARRVEVLFDAAGVRFTRRHSIIGFDSLVDRIVLSIEDACALATRERLRECEATDCDWLFFDRSRAGRRRWCHSAQCGNAERVRNFRRRRDVGRRNTKVRG